MSELTNQIALYQVYKSLIHLPANTRRCISNLLIHLQIGKLIIINNNNNNNNNDDDDDFYLLMFTVMEVQSQKLIKCLN